MLYNLEFLRQGQVWPPKEETDRLNRYKKNMQLFEGRHAEVYADSFKRIQRVIGNFAEVISYEFIANYQKMITLKTIDLIFGEPPKITAGDDVESAQQERLNAVSNNSNLNCVNDEVGIDISRCGDGIYQVYDDNLDTGVIGPLRPDIWFPVVDQANIKRILYHVIAWPTIDDKGVTVGLTVHIHGKGQIEKRQYIVNKSDLGAYTSETIQTGLNDFAVFPVQGLLTSDKVTGIDDYMDVDSVVSELLVRVAQISKVLDKFSEPSAQGPASALEYDADANQYKLKFGSYFSRDSEQDPKVEMIVWDAEMDANFKAVELLTNTLYRISEVGSLIFSDQAMKNGDVTGPGMKRIHMAAIAKAARVKKRLDLALRKALSAATSLTTGLKILPEDISIQWQDGLPTDPQEEATTISTLYTAGLMSLETALKRLGFEGQALQEEMARIQEEKAAAMAVDLARFNTQQEDGQVA